MVTIAAYESSDQMHTVVVGKDSPIQKPQDLIGKRLGMQFGSSTHGAALLYLTKNGIDPKAVQLINLPQKDLIEALISGSIDALAASEPSPMMAIKKIPGARALACLEKLGNDYPLTLVATKAFADAHPEAVRAVLAGLRRSIEWINRDPAAAAAETAKVTGDIADIEEAVFRRMTWAVKLDESVYRSLEQTATFLQEQKKIPRLPDIRANSRPTLVAP
jgi:ABC-type nitrate/sulfonate/bicarbonate transport system substrate-binding protein